MKRADQGLPFLLQYENVAWYEDASVRILDRRVYPMKTEYVVCRSHREVAQAIADMVTQSGGPYAAAAMGMALAAHESRGMKEAERVRYLEDAAYVLSHARPTTVERMKDYTGRGLKAAVDAIKNGNDAVQAAFDCAVQGLENKYCTYTKVGENLAAVIEDGSTILTQCFAETVVGTMLRAVRLNGKEIKVFCAETRPYFQGSRLTASCVCDMGFDVTVITDNMPAYTMKEKNISLFTSAADVVCMDGHIVNKVGTFQIALAAQYHGIPYYVTGTPDQSHPTVDTVKIEERDGELVLRALDTKVTMQGVKGYYPAFDITPPDLVTGLVTDKGIFDPGCFNDYL